MRNIPNLEKYTLKTLLSSLEEAVSVVDKEGIVLYWNEGAEETYEIKKEDIIGKNIRQFFNQEDIMHLKVLKSKKPVRDRYHIPRPDKHVLISTTLIYGEKKEILGSVSIEKDITSTIQLNEKLTIASKEIQQLKSHLKEQQFEPFGKIIGANGSLQSIVKDAKKIAVTDATILITGESGVGKELFARAIHDASPRKDKPFIAINCGAIPQSLFESELFGYESGAYTGAVKGGKPGKFEQAEGGTLFLDEIGELPLEMQVKFLRALQENEIYRIGGVVPRKVNVRIIAATNQVLEKMIEQGSFRNDLYYRLNIFSLPIPPLRERKGDLTLLVEEFLDEFSMKYHRPKMNISKEALEIMYQYHWPGNIRELRNILERLVVLTEGDAISGEDVRSILAIDGLETSEHGMVDTLSSEKERLEKKKIEEALRYTYGNKSAAAKLLGLSRATLYKKLKDYNIRL